MFLPFKKYQATGNDFIMVDFEIWKDYLNEQRVYNVCHRRFGIGADGLIAVSLPENGIPNMLYFNSDGKEGSFCGNGGRAFIKYLYDKKIIPPDKWIPFTAYDGQHLAKIREENRQYHVVDLRMKDVQEINCRNSDFILDTGSPHYVRFVNDLSEMDVVAEGRKIRYSDLFKEKGINVNFVVAMPNGELSVKTYERGVEDLTWSCGTGTVAAALAHAHHKGIQEGTLKVNVPGGKLEVSFRGNKPQQGFNEIILSGPAVFVFEGNYEIPD